MTSLNEVAKIGLLSKKLGHRSQSACSVNINQEDTKYLFIGIKGQEIKLIIGIFTIEIREILQWELQPKKH